MPDAVTTPRERVVTVRRFASFEEADRHELEYWAQLTDEARVLQAWILSRDLWRLRGDQDDEPRLRRSVASVRRG
jgi:hypothetical protein